MWFFSSTAPLRKDPKWYLKKHIVMILSDCLNGEYIRKILKFWEKTAHENRVYFEIAGTKHRLPSRGIFSSINKPTIIFWRRGETPIISKMSLVRGWLSQKKLPHSKPEAKIRPVAKFKSITDLSKNVRGYSGKNGIKNTSNPYNLSIKKWIQIL